MTEEMIHKLEMTCAVAFSYGFVSGFFTLAAILAISKMLREVNVSIDKYVDALKREQKR